MKQALLLSLIIFCFLIRNNPIKSQDVLDTELKNEVLIGVTERDQDSFYILRPEIITMSYSTALFTPTYAVMPPSGGNIDTGYAPLWQKPNIAEIKQGLNKEIFYRHQNHFTHQRLDGNSVLTDVVVTYHKEHFQLVYIDNDVLLDSEIDDRSIMLNLINFQGQRSKFEMITDYSTIHFVVKFRLGGIAVFTPGSLTKMNVYHYDNQLNFIRIQSEVISLSYFYLKAYELEDNGFVLCNIVNSVLKCIGGVYAYDTTTPAISFVGSLFDVINPCVYAYWYYIKPLGDTGQAFATCRNTSDKYLMARKFNKRIIKSPLMQTNYNTVNMIHGIVIKSPSVIAVITYGYWRAIDVNRYVRIERYTFPLCRDYTLDIRINDKFSLYKAGVFNSQSDKVSIGLLPPVGKIVDNSNNAVQENQIFSIVSFYYKRAASGVYSLRYEIVEGEYFSSPCKVTINVFCYFTCKTCNSMGDNVSNKCTSCLNGVISFDPPGNIEGNCGANCPEGKYSDINNQCQPCSSKCSTCIDAPTSTEDKCLTCPSGQYRLQVGSAYNCLSACPKEYYADSNNDCFICFDSCETCTQEGNPDIHNCSLCKAGTNILPLDYPATKFNCLEACPEDYFLVGSTCTKCHETCNQCNLNGDSSEHNCLTCQENLLFMPLISNPSVGNCISDCPLYYFPKIDTCKPCHGDCETCNGEGTVANSKCLTCRDNKKVLLAKPTDTSGNCFNDCPLNSYVLDGKCIKCFPFCETCATTGSAQMNNCITCIEDFLAVPIENGYNNCGYECPPKYFTLDGRKCEKCYDTCSQCEEGGSASLHNCLKCIEDYKVHPTIPNNCVVDCKGNGLYWLFNPANEYQCTTKKECPGDHPINEPEYAQCVKSCSNDPNCVLCGKTVLYQHRKECLRACPEFYEADSNNLCQRLPIDGLGNGNHTNGDIIFESKENKKDFIDDLGNMVDKSIDEILKSDQENPTIVVKNDDYEYIFSKAGEDLTNTTGSTIDLGDCEPKLRQAYNIPPEEDLYIGQVIFPQLNKTSNIMQYSIYDMRGKQLDLDYCKNIPVKINQPLLIDDTILSEAKRLLLMYNIDAFDPNSTFNNDICLNYTDINNQDYSLEGRRAKFIDKEALCNRGCEYLGINYTSNTTVCNCEASQKKITSTIDHNTIVDNVLSALPLGNIEIFICINMFFQSIDFLRNYGFLSIITLQSLQVVFFLFYVIFQMPVMFHHCTMIRFNPPPKRHSTVINKYIDNQKKEKEDHERGYDEIKNNKAVVEHCNDNENNIKVNTYSNRKDLVSSKMLTIKDLIDEHQIVDIKKKSNEKTINQPKIQIVGKNNQGFKNDDKAIDISEKGEGVEVFSSEELNEMEFDDAVESDKRSFCKYYWFILKTKEILLATITSEDVYNPYLQRIFLFFFILSAYLFVNALFYTEAFISTENYYDILFILTNELEKSFYSALVIKVISKLINLMLCLGSRIRKAQREKEKDKAKSKEDNEIIFQRKLAHLINGHKRNTFILFAIIILASLIVIYYVTVFCRLYPNNQVSWVVSTGVSITFNIILSTLLCLLMAATRFAGLKYKKSWIYSLSGYIAEIM